MEHLDGVINKPTSEMTDSELQFHYFKLHDYDGNNMLDGIELTAAMTHYHKGRRSFNFEQNHHTNRLVCLVS